MITNVFKKIIDISVARVFNTYGPRSYNAHKQDDPEQNLIVNSSNPIDERLRHLENHLSVPKPVPKDIYLRLKQIEDRLLQLESVSPEYAQFWVNFLIFYFRNKLIYFIFQSKTSVFEPYHHRPNKVEKRKYSIDDIDNLLLELQSKT